MAHATMTFQEWGTSLAPAAAEVVRRYLELFIDDMTTAELIGAYRKLIDLEQATDAEECALLDLLAGLS